MIKRQEYALLYNDAISAKNVLGFPITLFYSRPYQSFGYCCSCVPLSDNEIYVTTIYEYDHPSLPYTYVMSEDYDKNWKEVSNNVLNALAEMIKNDYK